MKVPEGRTQIWASGGGVQSAAIAALIVRGDLPGPDLACIVDTGREQASTWAYMTAVVEPALAEAGITLHRVQKDDYATVDLYGGEAGDSLLLPAFTTLAGAGKMPAFCSNEWKRRVMQRWAARDRGVKLATIWLGISADERQRVNFAAGKWENRYPLIERRMNRGDCIALVARMGWPPPPRSSCWMCPNHADHEWRDIRDKRPEEWRRAIEFEREIRKRDPHVFLHGSAVPLDQVDLEDRNGSLFGGCASGYCFT